MSSISIEYPCSKDDPCSCHKHGFKHPVDGSGHKMGSSKKGKNI